MFELMDELRLAQERMEDNGNPSTLRVETWVRTTTLKHQFRIVQSGPDIFGGSQGRLNLHPKIIHLFAIICPDVHTECECACLLSKAPLLKYKFNEINKSDIWISCSWHSYSQNPEQKQQRCPSVDEWIRERCHAVEYDSSMWKNGILQSNYTKTNVMLSHSSVEVSKLDLIKAKRLRALWLLEAREIVAKERVGKGCVRGTKF